VSLLSLSDELGDVVDRTLVFVLESVGLAFESCFVNQTSRVGLKSRKGAGQVLINSLNFPDSSRVLELLRHVLLHGHDNAILALNRNSSTTSANGFKGILNLEKLAIGGELSNSFVVLRH